MRVQPAQRLADAPGQPSDHWYASGRGNLHSRCGFRRATFDESLELYRDGLGLPTEGIVRR